ncbi:MAG: hypothetical protein WC621_01290 [Patescibacteria group bacterium]
MKKVVIVGSAGPQEKVQHWKKFWEDNGYLVTGYPLPVPKKTFLEEYPKVHTEFFKNITETDILFVMNEDKNAITGYIGAETFAEIGFGIAQNLIYNKNIEVILLQMPDKSVQSYDEIVLWLKLGWIKLFKE